VPITVASSITGYSAKAIRRKIENGVWLEGREFRRAPDGHVLISLKGYWFRSEGEWRCSTTGTSSPRDERLAAESAVADSPAPADDRGQTTTIA
jgi:hypothetical protein